MSLYQLLLDAAAITFPFMGLTHLLTKIYFQKKLAEKPTQLNLDSTLGRLWEIKQLIDPTVGSMVVVFDEKAAYVSFANTLREKRATAESVADILLTGGTGWSNPTMYPLLESFEKCQKQLKSMQEKLDNEEKQLEAKREKLLQLEANEEVRLLTGLSIDK